MDLGQKVTDLVRQLSSIGDSIRSCADGSGTGAGQQRLLSALGAVRRAGSLAGGMAIRLRSLANPTSTLGWSTSSTKASPFRRLWPRLTVRSGAPRLPRRTV